jgi:putative ABC transport system permease protein
MKTLDTQIDESLSSQRLMRTLSVAFGILSVLVAGFGIYGVMSCLVSPPTREIGIRMAVGSPSSLVCRMIVRKVLFVAAVGIVPGLPAAYAPGKSAQSMLFGMTGGNP